MRLARAGCIRIGENVRRGTAFRSARKREKPLVHLRLAADGLVAVGRIERDPAVARDRNPHRIIGVTGRLQFLPVEPDAFTDLLGRSELIQQQVVAATRSNRPAESMSSVATCSARRTGLCQGSTSTAVPSRSRVVRAAMKVSIVRIADI